MKTRTWSEVRAKVAALNPEFADAIDRLDDHSHPIYEASYHYGDRMVKDGILQVRHKGELIPITDPSIPTEIYEDLAYNQQSNPVTFVLNKTIEIGFDQQDRRILMALYPTGCLFGTWMILERAQPFHPIFRWNLTAGASSTFLLPKASISKKHNKLRKQHNVTVSAPRGLLDHFEIFKQLNENSNSPWEMQVLYFSKSWFENIRSTEKHSLFLYLIDKAWEGSSFLRNQIFMTAIFNHVKSLINMRPSSHLAHTLKHIITIIYGGTPGFTVARDDSQLPLKTIQKRYKETYLLEYDPIVIQPAYLAAEPIYYSLSHESAIDYAARDSTFETLINELILLKDFTNAFKNILQQQEVVLKIEDSTFLNRMMSSKLEFYHSTPSLNEGIKSIDMLIKDDKNFGKKISQYSPFFKGLIQIKSA